jgi:hypothetical protein
MAESINPEKLHQELKTAGLPVVGVSSSGRVDYSRSLTSAEKEIATQVIKVHDPSVSDSAVFIQRLAQAGLSRDEVLYALWKSVAKGDEQYKDRLINIMNQF